MRSLLILMWVGFLTLPLGLFASPLLAEQIWIAPQRPTKAESGWYPRAIKVVDGRIDQFNATELRVVLRGDEAASLVAAHRVLWIEPEKQSEKEAAALKLFAAGSYSQSLRPFIDSLADRPPVWRQQWISMMAANAAWRGSQSKIALELVSQLDSSPMPPLVVAWLPIDWNAAVKSRGAAEVARDKLTDSSAAVRLVAASWLLSTPARRDAKPVLQQLALDQKRPVMARLAETLSWQLASPPEVVEKADRWLKKVDALPMVLQTGPSRLLVEKYQRSGLTKQATKLRLSLELTPVLPKLPGPE